MAAICLFECCTHDTVVFNADPIITERDGAGFDEFVEVGEFGAGAVFGDGGYGSDTTSSDCLCSFDDFTDDVGSV
jgi:hypothetical protein